MIGVRVNTYHFPASATMLKMWIIFSLGLIGYAFATPHITDQTIDFDNDKGKFFIKNILKSKNNDSKHMTAVDEKNDLIITSSKEKEIYDSQNTGERGIENVKLKEIRHNLSNVLTDLSTILNKIDSSRKSAMNLNPNSNSADYNIKSHKIFKRNADLIKNSKEKASKRDDSDNNNGQDNKNDSKLMSKENLMGNTRRMDVLEPNLNSEASSSNDAKQRIFKYIDESLADIASKVQLLDELKGALLNNSHFQIGYIVANVDTLGLNMKTLKKNMEANKHSWDDKKVLNVYDTVKASNSVLSNLLDGLKVLAPKRHQNNNQ